jgi:type I restriction enzyme S subunit
MSRFPNAALGDVCTIQQGKTLLKKDMADEGFPVFGANGHIGWADEYHYDKPVVVIGCRGSCGATHTTLPKSFVTNNAMALLPKNTDDLHMDFLRVVISSAELSKVITGGVQPQITRTNLQQHEIPLPPIEEQRRIVDILNRAASIERLKARASTHLLDFIPALFLKMFGDPIENPMGWPTVKLGDLVQGFQGGKNVQAGSGTSPYRILKVSAVTSGEFRADESKPAPDHYKPPADHFLRDGDILFSRANTADLVGATALVHKAPEGVLLPDKLWRVVLKRNGQVAPMFLLSVLKDRSVRAAMSQLATGTSSSMQNISQAKLKTLPVIIPPLQLQHQFANLVEAAQARARLAAKADSLAAGLSRSLLDKLLGTDGTAQADPQDDAPDALAV